MWKASELFKVLWCFVCECGQHFHENQLLAKCFCGWGVKDNVDRAEMGMNEDSTFDGEFWEVNY